MTTEFERNLEKYAEVAVKIGLDFQAGQAFYLRAPIEARELVHAVVRQAYKAGASEVIVNWSDPVLDLIRLQHASDEALVAFPHWQMEHMVKFMDDGGAIMGIGASDPELLAGQDPERMKKYRKVVDEGNQPRLERIVKNVTNWLGISAPHPASSAKIFPDLSPEEARERHWDAIFELCRIKNDDPVGAWQAHMADLGARSDYLNNKAYSALQYTAPNTNLRVGLPKGHMWITAGLEMNNGTKPAVNIPTEEIFTLAHRDQIDGVVTSTKPLQFMGMTIENFTLQLSEGSVVSATAEKGQEALDIILATDEGARSFGELALVPHSSPISQSGLTFFNTLYDENASSHIALGAAYRFTLEGGTTMPDEDFADAGGNLSMTHVDFMIGSDKMDIDGITADGTAEPIMRAGEWAFEV